MSRNNGLRVASGTNQGQFILFESAKETWSEDVPQSISSRARQLHPSSQLLSYVVPANSATVAQTGWRTHFPERFVGNEIAKVVVLVKACQNG